MTFSFPVNFRINLYMSIQVLITLCLIFLLPWHYPLYFYGCLIATYWYWWLIFRPLARLFCPASFSCCCYSSCSNPAGASFRGRSCFPNCALLVGTYTVCAWRAGGIGPDATGFGSQTTGWNVRTQKTSLCVLLSLWLDLFSYWCWRFESGFVWCTGPLKLLLQVIN